MSSGDRWPVIGDQWRLIGFGIVRHGLRWMPEARPNWLGWPLLPAPPAYPFPRYSRQFSVVSRQKAGLQVRGACERALILSAHFLKTDDLRLATTDGLVAQLVRAHA